MNIRNNFKFITTLKLPEEIRNWNCIIIFIKRDLKINLNNKLNIYGAINLKSH